MDPQVSVAAADEKIKSRDPRALAGPGSMPSCELPEDFRLAFDLLWLAWGSNSATLPCAGSSICSRLVETVPANGDAVAHRRAVSLNVIEIPRNRVDMDIAWHQPGTRFDAGRKEARMQSPWVGRGRVIA